ncbi:hypothetical protein BDR07DRAFT_1420084, partial [Suillus spraguei]
FSLSPANLISLKRILTSTVSLGRDRSVQLNDNECHFVSHVLAFFTASDGIVDENLTEHFFNDDVQAAETRYFYGFQIMMENLS